MAPAQTLYPRATLRKTIKAHSGKGVSKNVDVLVFLDYLVFMERLIRESRIVSKQANERTISARSVRKVRRDVMSAFKG
ncbi:hypothetical protein M011DRAFT_468420 [Sporormia fimetaria CBS 119925]|uniref:Transcription factor CBF/NF-Y/archaeal histone domain-containing protein n=1 Tax=Sporormia fimetaria CBS 119925 TaxID=1340428 RepID=A0A6A6VAJ5_9PLEO|nr:hypothetical protein M011DRAFT_468420 [Sporormia fimetaria CBS 119925]